ncbi:hypothetical protein ACFL02_09385 [Planctomycetota bacterium]
MKTWRKKISEMSIMFPVFHGLLAIMTYLAFLSNKNPESFIIKDIAPRAFFPLAFIDFPIWVIYGYVVVLVEEGFETKLSAWLSETVLLCYLLTVGTLYWYCIGWVLEKIVIKLGKAKSA